MNASEEPVSSPPVSSRRLPQLLFFTMGGCIGALLSCMMAVCIIAGFVAYIIKPPEGLQVTYEIPAQVGEGETFDLTLDVTNTGRADINIGDIDLQSMFNPTILEGVLVLDTEPQMECNKVFDGVTTYYYNRTLKPGETQTVVFHLQAFKPGSFGGPVDIYVGLHSYGVYPSITVTQ